MKERDDARVRFDSDALQLSEGALKRRKRSAKVTEGRLSKSLWQLS